MTNFLKNNNLVFAHGETQGLVVVCLSAELSMFLLCGAVLVLVPVETVSYFPVQLLC